MNGSEDGVSVKNNVYIILKYRSGEDRMNLETPEDGQWKLIVDVKLFADCSADAQAVEVKGQQKVYPLKAIYKTSGTRFDDCWLLLETENGEQGWIYESHRLVGTKEEMS